MLVKSCEAIRNRRLVWPALVTAVVLLLVGLAAWQLGFLIRKPPTQFDGSLAYTQVVRQMDFGPRITGTEGNYAAGNYIVQQLRQLSWQADFQPFDYKGVHARNIIARANVGKGPVIILGAHYDTRRRADRDPEHPDQPVPGADDGASGVAVLLELARSLDLTHVHNEVWLAFFDAEDDGELDGWDWIVGSTYMAQHLAVKPQSMILVDMVGDADQNIYMDSNSDPQLSAQIWSVAAQLGYVNNFIPVPRYAMLDDHTPFAQQGIPAVDIIDFDYRYWHTVADTADKLSPASLEHVGRTVETYLQSLSP
jgi:glutaminyl-peptide cyclotransferase